MKYLFPLILLLFIPVSAVEYSINESDINQAESYSVYISGIYSEDDSDTATYIDPLELNHVYIDFSSYPRVDEMKFYIRTGSGSWSWELEYYEDGSYHQINDSSPGVCMPFKIVSYWTSGSPTYQNITPPINGSMCIWPGTETGRYTVWMDLNENDYANQSGINEHHQWTLQWTGSRSLYWNHGANAITNRSAIEYHANFYHGGGGDEFYGEFPEWQGSWTKYNKVDASDSYSYSYSYNSETGTESAYLNVTKSGTSTKWTDCYWKSILEGDSTLHETDIETSFDQTGFNQNFVGYLINCSWYYKEIGYQLMTFSQPEGEAEGAGNYQVEFYFEDVQTNSLIDEVTFNVWGDYSFSGQVNKTKWINVDYDSTLLYNASAANYTWEGDLYGYDGYVYVTSDTIVYVNFIPETTEGLEDSVNNTWLNFLVEGLGNESISGAEITVSNSNSYSGTTDNDGFKKFEVPKNDTYSFVVEKTGYYTSVGSVDVGSEPVIVLVSMTEIPEATPLPTDEAGNVDYVGNPELKEQRINQFLNIGWEMGYAIFCLALLATFVYVAKRMGG